MFINREDAVHRFRDIFVEVDGQSYFWVNGLDFMIPVSDEQIFELTETFRFRHRIAMALTWIVWLGAVAWWYVWVVSDEPGYRGWWILGGGFVASGIIQLISSLSTTWRLRRFARNVHHGRLPRPANARPVPREAPGDW